MILKVLDKKILLATETKPAKRKRLTAAFPSGESFTPGWTHQ